MKPRKLNIFTLSFIDCITCGLGAIILLFVIVNASSSVQRNETTKDLRGEVERLEREVLISTKHLVEVRNVLDETIEELVKTEGLSRQVLKTLIEKKTELSASENDTLATKEHINRLKADLLSLEEERKRLEGGSKSKDDYGDKVRRFAGEGDRQYLTDLKVGGTRIFMLVDASASMLDETIVGVIRRRNLADSEKLRSPKWQQVVSSVDWLTTHIPPSSKFQIYTFNETAEPLIKGTAGKWLDASDVDRLDEAVRQLRRTVPEKGTSLVNAFHALRQMTPPPDNIFLLTDSLPTMGEKGSWGKRVSSEKRLSLFNDAVRVLNLKIPVNIILYPMEGDPFASSAFWQLAVASQGSFFCPSRDWP